MISVRFRLNIKIQFLQENPWIFLIMFVDLNFHEERAQIINRLSFEILKETILENIIYYNCKNVLFVIYSFSFL